jgi:hypothetical protein
MSAASETEVLIQAERDIVRARRRYHRHHT